MAATPEIDPKAFMDDLIERSQSPLIQHELGQFWGLADASSTRCFEFGAKLTTEFEARSMTTPSGQEFVYADTLLYGLTHGYRFRDNNASLFIAAAGNALRFEAAKIGTPVIHNVFTFHNNRFDNPWRVSAGILAQPALVSAVRSPFPSEPTNVRVTFNYEDGHVVEESWRHGHERAIGQKEIRKSVSSWARGSLALNDANQEQLRRPFEVTNALHGLAAIVPIEKHLRGLGSLDAVKTRTLARLPEIYAGRVADLVDALPAIKKVGGDDKFDSSLGWIIANRGSSMNLVALTDRVAKTIFPDYDERKNSVEDLEMLATAIHRMIGTQVQSSEPESR